MSNDSRRIEAIPRKWDDLSETQKTAAESVAKWLVDALDAVPKVKEINEDRRKDRYGIPSPTLDTNRHSQLAFIDGDRGTGKSSVLLSLMDLTSRDDQNKESLSDAVQRLYDRRRRVIWLETLDMEPLSKGINLFAAILARLERILDAKMKVISPLSAVLGSKSPLAEVVTNLAQLQNDAALVWERPAGCEHKGDAQARALSTMQAERAGLNLHGRFAEVMNGLAWLVASDNSEQDHIFVLPVDDFDLAPAHCLELLRLIRMVTTPRLFFLVAGNIRIAETVLKLKTEGELWKLADSKGSNSTEILNSAWEIAANNLRKLLPPGQRARLAAISLTDALELKIGEDDKTLRQELDALKVLRFREMAKDRKISFSELFLLEHQIPSESAQWLSGTHRQVIDIYRILKSFGEVSIKDKSENEFNRRVVGSVLEELRRQIKEEWQLPYAVRDRLDKALDGYRNGTVDFETNITVEYEFIRAPVSTKFEYEKLKSSVASGPPRVFARGADQTSPRRQKNELNEKQQKEDDEQTQTLGVELPRRLAAGILLAHDLLAGLDGSDQRQRPLPYTQSDPAPGVWARWGTGEQYTDIIWPMPRWRTFRDCERFDRHWRRYVSEAEEKQCGLAWLTSILEVVLDEPYRDDWRNQTSLRLIKLLGRFIQVVENSELYPIVDLELYRNTLARVVVLFAPENETHLSIDILVSVREYLQKDVTIMENIRRMRAQDFFSASKGGKINTETGATLCANISPVLAYLHVLPKELRMNLTRKILQSDYSNKEKLKNILMNDNIMIIFRSDDNKLEYLINFLKSDEIEDDLNDIFLQKEPPKNALAVVRQSDKRIINSEPEHLKKLIMVLDAVVNGLKHPFNNFLEGAFIPTERDLEPFKRDAEPSP